VSSDISKKLDTSRIELLDLSLRNSFINYRALKSKGVDIINEVSQEVFRIMVKEEKSMIFEAISDVNDESYKLITPESISDLKLQSNINEKELQTRLLNTYYAARTFIEEQGVNNLFLALGMLKWKTDDDVEKELSAPIVLVPVELIRSNAKEMFRLKYTGEDIQENLSLITKLSNEYKIQIPPFNEEDEFDINSYFNKFIEAVQRMYSWKVDPNAISLGFFSFGKYLMYKDLDESIWSEKSKPESHPILSALLGTGFKDHIEQIPDNENIDSFLSPLDTNHVMDADSTQILAMSDIQKGSNLVIQGPPGTGKSQTITNIIADAINAGKKILFISEKMAALDVVKRRLDKIGLGDACLELHSQKTNKKTVLSELKRVYELGEPKIKDVSADMKILLESRDSINSYCESINTRIGNSNLTPIQVYGYLLKLQRNNKEADIPDISTPETASWNDEEYKRKEALVCDLNAHLNNMGIPKNHPFWGSIKKTYIPTDEPRYREALKKLQTSYDVLLLKALEVNSKYSFGSTESLIDIEKISNALIMFSTSPDISGVQINDPSWKSNQEIIQKLINAGLNAQLAKTKNTEVLRPEAWSYDISDVRQTLNIYKSKWWRFLSVKYRKAKNTLLGFCQNRLPEKYGDWLDLCDSILVYRNCTYLLNSEGKILKHLFAEKYKGEFSDWNQLSKVTEWAVSVYSKLDSGIIPSGLLSVINNTPKPSEAECNELKSIIEVYKNSFEGILTLFELNQKQLFSEDSWLSSSLSIQKNYIFGWSNNLPKLQEMVLFNHFADSISNEGLKKLYDYVVDFSLTSISLKDILLYNRCEKLLEKSFNERPVLAMFGRDKHESVIKRFQELDRLLISFNQLRLAHKHWESIPKSNSDSGQIGILTWEFQKKSRHLPLRQLMIKAGNIIQVIKPVFMMSPISVANFLTPDTLSFDLVIFDEASQVKPVESFGAILRGKQVVVVGDSKQMPPTSFFDQITSVETEEEFSTSDVESILSLFEAQNAPSRMLRWHYRSRHESLIAVSNYEFYESKLVVFPSPQKPDQSMGLVYNHITDSVYDKGNSRVNSIEAKHIAMRVMQHAKETPDLTLGVAALSIPQKQAILDEIEILRRNDLSLESYFNSHPDEPFFVKNLENVQGDERDVILISIGYGKTKDGALSMNFGPLNNIGGERRLNVLISRARLKCEVFTNLRPDDIDLSRTNSRGVEALKTFLTYAKDDHMDIPFETGKLEDSPFEEEVFITLQNHGYNVKKQIGCAGFFIDLAITDPKNESRYVLGIECDGASYHSARSARDRDRLRQTILESKGWNIYRIWSTDWFRNKDIETQKLINAISTAIANKDIPKSVNANSNTSFSSAPIKREEHSPVVASDKIISNEYKLTILPSIDQNDIYNPKKLAEYIEKIVLTESPIHIVEASRRILSFTEITRLGSAIQKSIDEACIIAQNKGNITLKGSFLWSKDIIIKSPRDRSNLPSSSRKLELIAEEEVSLAIYEAVKASFGLSKDETASLASQSLGFSRVTAETKEEIESIIQKMIDTGKLKENNSNIFVNE